MAGGDDRSERNLSQPPRKRIRRARRSREGGDSSDGSESDSSASSHSVNVRGGDEEDVAFGDDEELGDGAQAAEAALRTGDGAPRVVPGRTIAALTADAQGGDDDDEEDEEDEFGGGYRGRRPSRRRANSDEESEGEDLIEDIERDYRPIAELDRYDMNELDTNAYETISVNARRAAEAELIERDREERRGQTRMPDMLGDDSDDSDDSDDEERERARARRAAYEFAAAGGEPPKPEGPVQHERVDLQSINVPVRDVIDREPIREEIRQRFENFLREFSEGESETPVYEECINEMCSRNSQSLVISYGHLSRSKPTLAIWLADEPRLILPLMDEVARAVVLDLYPNYAEIHNEVFVRVGNLPLEDSLRELRTMHLRQLVRVSGIVTRRSQVLPQLKLVSFVCKTCGERVGTVEVTDEKEPQGPPCDACEEDGGQQSYTVADHETAVYRNFQRILLQESPGSVPPGRVPRYKTVIMTCDLIDNARPGEEIEVTGVYVNQLNRQLNTQQGFPVFTTCIEANYVRKKEDLGASKIITEKDRKEFYRLARDPRIADRVINSIAPSIYGNKHIKTALAVAMFGGRAKNVKNKHNIRGDINVLLMGDPGTAKSQCLKYVEKTAPRAVYTTGKGASAVGLTAAVQKDPITKDWVLEAGALVLADRGVCMIDEFDKMNDRDRTSIHEAMEQQSISISKAGIVATLQARCSVIAAANPIGGRYDPQKSFAENVELSDPIIQRFDVLCVLQDRIDPMADERLAKFVVGSHVTSHPEGCVSAEEAHKLGTGENATTKNVNTYATWSAGETDKDGAIDQELLRKYILYARTLKPQLEHIDNNKIVKLYVELRRESMTSGGVPIAVRHMESVLRLSEAFARIHLRQQVSDDDVNRAIAVMIDSFIQAQKFSVMRQLKRSFAKYLTFKKDNNELLASVLEELLQQSQHLAGATNSSFQVSVSEFERRARELGIHDLTHFFKSDVFNQRGLSLREVVNPAFRSGVSRLIVKDFTS
eukprot:CAMPEP_0184545368 /NCGR_PEP_ID=MMETSP0199_2-20130426/4253_1 /TAXON_ID=1112570 /ORGANISM="Thraustochytrium sp., Strain LLF1b" /LENGTH=999 /DNA_ID=CAMNT_0026939663 /DNA_START=157 /DNA_END=3156 /DNA_ORIENTATION=-